MFSTADQFQESFEKFKRDLVEYCSVSKITWNRYGTETYNHKRTLEVSIWCKISDQEFGHVFLARSMEWDGSVDWDRLKLIIEDHDKMIGPFETTRVWNLARIGEQLTPLGRCQICGQLEGQA